MVPPESGEYTRPLSDLDRKELAFHHPLFTEQVLLPTHPIDELYLLINRMVMLRETGCCFSAASGIGKTFAIDMVEAMIHNQMPELRVVKHNTHNQQLPSIRAFFKHFLSTINHDLRKGETFDLRDRLVLWLIDEARISGTNMVLLFVDEAHAMTSSDFYFLKDVHNDLHREGVQLISVLMGQSPDLEQVIDRLKHDNRLDLIGRFAMNRMKFRGFDSLKDLEKLMEGIDSATYPEGTDISWTEFYFPQAHESGFRMKSQASPLWKAIRKSCKGRDKTEFEIPTRQLFIAIRNFMYVNAERDKAGMTLSGKLWSDAIAYASLIEAMTLINAIKPKAKQLSF